ncbi:Glycosyltransferase [uncultured Gammaproteobacteria bacterium]
MGTMSAMKTEARALHSRAIKLLRAGRADEAVVVLKQVLNLFPNNSSVTLDLGSALRKAGRFKEAAMTTRSALAHMADNAGAWSNLGNALKDLGDIENSLTAHGRAVALAPKDPLYWLNQAVALSFAGRPAEALASIGRVLELQPGNVEAAWERAQLLLMQGNFADGWPAYECRWQLSNPPPKLVTGPEWDGRPFPGRMLHLFCEQGFGDTILALRFLPQVKALGGNITVECQPQIFPLVQRLPWVDRIIAKDGERPPFDYCLSLMSLPRLFASRAEAMNGAPYLVPSPETEACLAPLFASAQGMTRIGIIWSGSTTFRRNNIRAITLPTLLEAVHGVPGIRLYSLQKGPPERELHDLPPGHGIVDLAPHLHDFGDTAAAIRHLDLVIMTDSAVAHLCGALGRPVWVLLGFGSYVLWGRNPESTCWYDSMRLFRQDRPGDWAGVSHRVWNALLDRTLRANNDETPAPRKFTLEGVGEQSRGHAQ